jgi:transcriptional regulator NrdR family protein
MGAIREVRKRDDRVVPFDETKIADAIYQAIRSVGRGDRSLAEELAQAVTHFLEKKFAGMIPGIEDIQDQVETVLIETGHAEIAKSYILYRNKRGALREALQVCKAPPETSLEDTVTPLDGPELVEDRGGVAPWSKGKIVAALIREADMEISVAEEVASAVERKVFASGIRRISTSLIRELVDNELFERGFSSKLRKQAPIGLPKYNLEQIIFGTDTKEGFTFPKTPLEVRDFIATGILEQYALLEVFSPEVADAHREGRIHLHGLGDPIRFFRLIWDLAPPRGLPDPGLDPGGDGSPDAQDDRAGYLDLGDLYRRLGQLIHFTSAEIRLRRPNGLFLDRSLGNLDDRGRAEAILRRWAEALPETAPQRSRQALELDLDGQSIPWLSSLADRPPQRGPSLYLRLVASSRNGSADPLRRKALEKAAVLFERGEPIEFLPQGPRPAPGGRLTPVAAGITINLPRAAFRSATVRRTSVEREVEEALEVAIKGHLERRRFLERLGANRENPLWDILGRPSDRRGRPLMALEDAEFPVGVLGLNECVKFLTGHELHQDPRARTVGESIVQALARKVQRDSRGLGLRLVLAESVNCGELRRLEKLDRLRFAESDEIDRGRGALDRVGAAGARYTDGVRLYRNAPVDPLRRIEHLGAFLAWVDPLGLIEDSPELRGGGPELILSLLEESMPYLTRSHRGGSHPGGLFEEPPAVSGSVGEVRP